MYLPRAISLPCSIFSHLSIMEWHRNVSLITDKITILLLCFNSHFIEIFKCIMYHTFFESHKMIRKKLSDCIYSIY